MNENISEWRNYVQTVIPNDGLIVNILFDVF